MKKILYLVLVAIGFVACTSDDGPGSSTVDPIDPNQLKVELNGCMLSVYENVEESVEIMISNSEHGEPASISKKEMKNGQLYIRQGNSICAQPDKKVE